MSTPAFLDVSRRQFFRQSGLGLGSMALGSMLARDLPAAAALAGPQSHFAPKAKHIIYLHMIGAPSQLDLFDYKPLLQKMDGQTCPAELTQGKRFAFIGGEMKLAGTEFKFQRHGQSGLELSELLPHLGTVADDICVVKSLHTNEINHAPAQMFLHTGFLPSVYQGIQFRGSGEPVLFLGNPPGHSTTDRRRVLDAVKALNEQQLGIVGDPEIATRISQYEMAYRMQTSVPELMDITRENPATLDMYGALPGKASFANNCLLARRLIERGVRMVQLFDSDWDHHGGLKRALTAKAKDVDQPMAALVRDLKQRGLLDETLVIWGGEFGRTPLRQGANQDGTKTSPGRDHHKDAYTMWMAGGGTRPGTVYGRTDDFGFNIAENPVHTHDLNATVLNLLGLDHERLTFRYQGRDFRLTDVHGELVPGILG